MVVAKRRALQSQLNLPPGFRFTPTDEELLIHYLGKKAASEAFPVPIIGELDLYKFDPWDLPGMALLGEKEWYFFSTRSRKYPNGSRPNRVALSGYWKATGTDKPIYSCTSSRLKVGVKKALVFYKGRAPRGLKTNWIMHEYRLPDISNRGSFGEDDWVLCRIYERRSKSTPNMVKQAAGKREEEESLCFHRDDLAIAAMPCLDAAKESSRSPLDMGAGLERVPAIADFRQQQEVEEGELASSYFCSNSALPMNGWGSDDFKSCLRLAGQPFPSNSFLMGLELEALPSHFPRLEPMTHSSYFAS